MRDFVEILGMMSLFRNANTGSRFISNWYENELWREVGDLVEVKKEIFERDGFHVLLFHLMRKPGPLPPDDKIPHKEIRRRTRGMKEVMITLFANEEIEISPVRGLDVSREGSARIKTDADQDVFLRILEEVYECSRRSL